MRPHSLFMQPQYYCQTPAKVRVEGDDQTKPVLGQSGYTRFRSEN